MNRGPTPDSAQRRTGRRLMQAMRSYGCALGTELFIVVATLFVFGMVARRIGPVGFAEYQIARATLTSAQPALLLGLGVALPRFVAYSIGRHGSVGTGYLRVALGAGGAVVVLVAPLALIFRHGLAALIFGASESSDVVFGLVMSATGLIADGIAYGYLRGTQRALPANLVHAVTSGVAPLLGVLCGRTVVSLLVVAGAVATGFALLMLYLYRPSRDVTPRSENGRDMIRYGIRRVPGDICSALLLTLPTICAAHLVGVVHAGFIGFGTSAIALVVAALSPIAYVLLPYLSREIGAGRRESAYRATRWLPCACGAGALLVAGVLWLVMPFLVHVYLGAEFVDATEVARLMLISAVPLAVYLGGRSIIDAYYRGARNSVHLQVAVLIQIVVVVVGPMIMSGLAAVVLGTVLATATLAVLTIYAQLAIGRGVTALSETGRRTR